MKDERDSNSMYDRNPFMRRPDGPTKYRMAGSADGQIKVGTDFDKPLEEFDDSKDFPPVNSMDDLAIGEAKQKEKKLDSRVRGKDGKKKKKKDSKAQPLGSRVRGKDGGTTEVAQ